jgi:hypothetical protein
VPLLQLTEQSSFEVPVQKKYVCLLDKRMLMAAENDNRYYCYKYNQKILGKCSKVSTG